jgi:hypothetical protein
VSIGRSEEFKGAIVTSVEVLTVSCQNWTRLLQSQSFYGIFDDCFDRTMPQHYAWGHRGVTQRDIISSQRQTHHDPVTDQAVRHPVAEKAVRRYLALLPSIEQSGDDYPSSLGQRQESTFEHPFVLSVDLAKHQCPLMAL